MQEGVTCIHLKSKHPVASSSPSPCVIGTQPRCRPSCPSVASQKANSTSFSQPGLGVSPPLTLNPGCYYLCTCLPAFWVGSLSCLLLHHLAWFFLQCVLSVTSVESNFWEGGREEDMPLCPEKCLDAFEMEGTLDNDHILLTLCQPA